MSPPHAPPPTEESIQDPVVTEIRIRLNESGRDEILKAYVSVTLNDCLAIHNLKIIHGSRGLFVSMPARRNKTGGFSDIVHPTNTPFRDYLESVVISAYLRERGYPEGDGEGGE